MRPKILPLAAFLTVLFPAYGLAEAVSFEIDRLTFTFEIEPEQEAGYDRDDWSHWNEHLGDQCFTVRDKVLAEESYIPVITTPASDQRCRVIKGVWIDPYTGQSFIPSDEVDIDHLVPLKEAHDSGGHAWSEERREAYANYLGYSFHLIAVEDGENQSKGDDDPADYLPPNQDFVCQYLEAWIRVKHEWELNMDQLEADVIEEALEGC